MTDNHRQQCQTLLTAIIVQPASAICATPLKHLVRVHAFGPRHCCNARSRHHRQLYDPPLLSHRPSHTYPTVRHESIVATRRPFRLLGNTGRLLWSLIKRGIGGVYHSVSQKYLQSYLDEYSFRYNRRFDTEPMFTSFLHQIEKVQPDETPSEELVQSLAG